MKWTSRPRMLTALAVLTLIVSSLGVGHGMARVLPFAEGHETFVDKMRDSLAAQLPRLNPEERRRLGEEYAEREWARRGAVVPLGLCNLILSFLLFSGAIEALRGHTWGASAWEWSAKLSIPYTIVAMLLLRAEMRDLGAGLGSSLRELTPGGAQTVGEMESLARGAAALYALVMVGFYLTCVLYLQRPKTRVLFPEVQEEEEGGEED